MGQSTFEREMAQAPAALRALADAYGPSNEDGLRLAALARQIRSYRRLTITGLGSSLWAAQAMAPMMEDAGIAVTVRDAGELLHYGGTQRDDEVALLISQSGESAEIVRLLQTRKLAHGTGRVWGVTNTPSSALFRAMQDRALLLHAGEEQTIACKTYSNTLGLLLLLSALLRSTQERDGAMSWLNHFAEAMTSFDHILAQRAAETLAAANALLVVGRGPAYGSARQLALTLCEGVRRPAMAMTGAECRHGPLEIAGQTGVGLITFCCVGQTTDQMRQLVADFQRNGTPVVVLTDAPHAFKRTDADRTGDHKKGALFPIPVPGWGEHSFPLSIAYAQAALVNALARRRGLVAGKFSHANKVTTDE